MRYLIALGLALAPAQTVVEEDFRIIGEHPRLLLNARRLRLLRRERERQSIRWQQLDLLITGKAQMAEPGFALALYSQVTEKPEFCRQAITWALGAQRDLRQLALVFDWCQAQLNESQSRALMARLEEGIRQTARATDLPAVRSRVLAAIGLAGHAPEASERELQRVVQEWWRRGIAPAFQHGESVIPRSAVYPLVELLHTVRDNLNIDLRESAVLYFRDLPSSQVLSYYPGPYPAPENEYRIPSFRGPGDPDLRLAAQSRAADLGLVAYDNNARESQYLQGWLIHDRFLMRSVYGAPYEFLWANPYQPGLSFYHMPLFFHDPRSGRLFLRSSWEEEATWFGIFDGQMQIFSEGRPVLLKAPFEPVAIGEALIMSAGNPLRFARPQRIEQTVYIVGLKPRQHYDLEVDDEEIREVEADAAGTLVLKFNRDDPAGFRLGPG